MPFCCHFDGAAAQGGPIGVLCFHLCNCKISVPSHVELTSAAAMLLLSCTIVSTTYACPLHCCVPQLSPASLVGLQLLGKASTAPAHCPQAAFLPWVTILVWLTNDAAQVSVFNPMPGHCGPSLLCRCWPRCARRAELRWRRPASCWPRAPAATPVACAWRACSAWGAGIWLQAARMLPGTGRRQC